MGTPQEGSTTRRKKNGKTKQSKIPVPYRYYTNITGLKGKNQVEGSKHCGHGRPSP